MIANVGDENGIKSVHEVFSGEGYGADNCSRPNSDYLPANTLPPPPGWVLNKASEKK